MRMPSCVQYANITLVLYTDLEIGVVAFVQNVNITLVVYIVLVIQMRLRAGSRTLGSWSPVGKCYGTQNSLQNTRKTHKRR